MMRSQLDLLMDYGSNVALYPQSPGQYLPGREAARPWSSFGARNGLNLHVPAGAEAFRRDVPGAGGASSRHGPLLRLRRIRYEIAGTIRDFSAAGRCGPPSGYVRRKLPSRDERNRLV